MLGERFGADGRLVQPVSPAVVAKAPSDDAYVEALNDVISRCYRKHHWFKKRGKVPICVKGGLTKAAMRAHVSGGTACGLAPIAPGESTTLIALLDNDSHKGETSLPEMQQTAARICAAAIKRGLRAIPFLSSGGQGIHLYFIWDSPQDAYSVRTLLRDVLAECGLRDGANGVAKGEVEVFPKQDEIEPDGFGNMFILPLAGQSVPLDDVLFDPLPKEAALDISWPVSDPVPVAERPQQRQVVPLNIDKTEAMARATEMLANLAPAVEGEGGNNRMYAAICAAADLGVEEHEMPEVAGPYNNRGEPPFEQDDFLTLIGNAYRHRQNPVGCALAMVASVEDFPDLTEAQDEALTPTLPRFTRDKHGKIRPLIENLRLAFLDPTFVGKRLGVDTFADQIMIAEAGTDDWRPMIDEDNVALRHQLERRNFKSIASQPMREVVAWIARTHEFDSARMWLEGVPPHDGVARVANFLTTYCGVDPTPYTVAAALYFWTALAGRTLVPGIEAPMALILSGAQGFGKSRSVKAIVVDPKFYVEIGLDVNEIETSRKIKGRQLAEIAELRGLGTRDLESIKAFISRTQETFTPKWKEFATTFQRRLVFVGTTNSTEFLADDTGERRWLPVTVARPCDVDGIVRDRLQLWAEARDLFRRSGVLYANAERLARREHQRYKVTDAWQDSISRWLGEGGVFGEELTNGEQPFTTAQVLGGALFFEPKQFNKGHEMRVAKLLAGLGYVKHRRTEGGERSTVWEKAIA